MPLINARGMGGGDTQGFFQPLGGSVRFDTGDVNGRTIANGLTDVCTVDLANDGVISEAERTFALARPTTCSTKPR